MKELVDNGDVLWVTVLAEDNSGNPADSDTAARWHEAFPNDNIAVLADNNYELFNWMGINGFPWAIMMDENMEIISFDGSSNNLKPLDTLEEMYAAGDFE